MATTPTKTKNRKQLPPSSESKHEEEPTAAVAEGDESKTKKEKTVNEIDEIFQGKKAKKTKTPAAGGQEQPDSGMKLAKGTGEGGGSKKKKDKKKGKRKVDPDESIEARGRRRRTADGFAIYSADELGFGKADAGGTPLCPFDCSCCF
ncbi:hypothetical protein Cni_G06397 [Canna indica]|uniref:DUF1764-domain-containing protein n=1 Tax=Canna indica TaxID=4628 RepID=A0AAQ3Q6G9_9LILI|nr:hypothetical protein Cni_G06397 [Canna indica]